jgi:anti-sigma factor RsiW
MSIPKEVILDLLPVYLAGEASPVTRAFLEQYLAQDPELAEQVRRQRTESFGQLPLPPLPPELELQSLRRTRQIMTRLRWLFAAGMTLSVISLSLRIDFSPLSIRLLLQDYPALLIPCLVAGVACWIGYFRLRRRLRTAR